MEFWNTHHEYSIQLGIIGVISVKLDKGIFIWYFLPNRYFELWDRWISKEIQSK